MNTYPDIRTKPFTSDDVGKYAKIAQVHLLSPFGTTKYFSTAFIFRVFLIEAGHVMSKTYMAFFNYINANLEYTITCISKYGNINILALQENDVVSLYVKAPAYSYNNGISVKMLYEEQAGYVELLPYNAFVDIDVTNALTIIDNTANEPITANIIMLNDSVANQMVATYHNKYLHITADITVQVASGNGVSNAILSFDYQTPNVTQWFIAYNRTQKTSVILVAYANTKNISITNLGGSITAGDTLVINADILTR